MTEVYIANSENGLIYHLQEFTCIDEAKAELLKLYQRAINLDYDDIESIKYSETILQYGYKDSLDCNYKYEIITNLAQLRNKRLTHNIRIKYKGEINDSSSRKKGEAVNEN